MAKERRIKIHLKCSQCGEQNYTTTKVRTEQEKLELKKFCKRCGGHTLHTEVKKLK